MSGYLSNLLARSLQPGAAIRPRRASWFEPTPGVNVAAPWLATTTEAVGVPSPGTLEGSGRARGQPAFSPDPVLEPPPALPISESAPAEVAPAEVAPKPVPFPSRPSLIEPARTVSVHAEPDRPEPGVEGASEAPLRPREATARPGPAIPALPLDAISAPRSAIEPDPPGAAVVPGPIRPKPGRLVETPQPPVVSPSLLLPDAPSAPLSAVEPDLPGAAVAPGPIRSKGTVEATERTSPPVRPLGPALPERPPLADIASPTPQSVTPRFPRQPAVDAPTIKPNVLAVPRFQEATQAAPASSEETPTIRVSIGRIEVRAVTPTPPRRKTVRQAPTMSLDDYLKQYRGRS